MILRDVRRHLERTAALNQLGDVAAAVGAERNPPAARQGIFDHHARCGLGVAVVGGSKLASARFMSGNRPYLLFG